MHEILVVGIDVDGGAKKDGEELLECFNNGEEFFFNGGVILLSGIKLLGIEGHGDAILFDDSPACCSWLSVSSRK